MGSARTVLVGMRHVEIKNRFTATTQSHRTLAVERTLNPAAVPHAQRVGGPSDLPISVTRHALCNCSHHSPSFPAPRHTLISLSLSPARVLVCACVCVRVCVCVCKHVTSRPSDL